MVVVPVRNGADFIEQTIKSLIAQTYEDVKIIVVDNFSTDDTDFIAFECGGIVYKNTEILARVENWNEALNVFRGSDYDYCKIVFAGDSITPDCIEKQMKRTTSEMQFISCAHKVIGGPGFDYIINRSTAKGGFITTPLESLKTSLSGGNWFAGTTSCVLFSKEILGDTKFDESLDWASDWKFWVDLSLKTNVCYIEDALAVFNFKARKGYQHFVGTELATQEELTVKKYIENKIKFLNKNENRSISSK